MIPVHPAPEYPNFDKDVRQRGNAILQSCPNPNSAQFSKHNYWNRARDQLHAAYSGFCAYTTRYLIYPESIDHFRPKSKYPHLAYEWTNYRLARQIVNSHKRNSTNVLDPFLVQPGWFTLQLPSCLIKSAPHLPRSLRSKVNATINTLRLNDDDRLVDERWQYLVDLADGDINMRHLQRQYPFLAQQVTAQGVQGSLKQILSRP